MRVCLINPPRIHPKSWGKPTAYQPLTIAYVAAVLEHQHKVSIIDSPTEGWNNLEQINESSYRVGLTDKEMTSRIKSWSPDIVGINVPFSGWSKAAFELAALIKNIDKDIITVFDGLHPSARPLDCLSDQNIDFIVRGEPEQTVSELVNTLEKGVNQELKKIEGIGFTENGKNVLTPPRRLIKDLDSLPFPARHLLPMDKYFDAVKEQPLRGVINRPWTPMMTSRGCPHQCIFCSVNIIMGRNWRGRSPENVVNEIEHLVNTYSIKQIDFIDNNMALDRKRMETICDMIVEKDLDIEWYTPDGLRADTLDEDLLRKMSLSGCKKIRVAPESGVQRVVNQVMKKNLNHKDVEKAVIAAKKVGIKVGVFFILGVIGETKEDMEETIRYAHKLKKLGADNFHFSVAMPLYGTELYEMAIRGGFLSKDFSVEKLAGTEPLIETSEFTTTEVLELCLRANEVNRTITRDKIVKAIKDPKKAISILKASLGRVGTR